MLKLFKKSFGIIWFGGEPLLAFQTMRDLNKDILGIVGKHGINYSSSIVTNGHLLTKDIAKTLLDEFHIRHIDLRLARKYNLM